MTKKVPVDALAGFREAHSTPSFNLAVEPWIPVMFKDGSVADVSLRELLEQAHEISDLAEYEPLTRAALRRYLIALVTYWIRENGIRSVDVDGRIETGRGFDPADVEWILGNQASHLWLYHPATPFMQDPRLLMSGLSPAAISELIPHAPGESTGMWFYKTGEPGVPDVLTAARAARYLVTRWFYVFAGNKGNGVIASPFVPKSADTCHTNCFINDPIKGLFASMLFNVTKAGVATPSKSKAKTTFGPSWMEPTRLIESEDPVWMLTYTTSSSLIGPMGLDSTIGNVICSTVDKKLQVDRIKKLRGADSSEEGQFGPQGMDPHTMWVQNFKDAKRTVLHANRPRRPLRIDPNTQTLGILAQMRRHPKSQYGVGDIGSLFTGRPSGDFELLVGKTIPGSAQSLKWAALTTRHVPVAYFLPGDNDAVDAIFNLVQGTEDAIKAACRKAATFRGDRLELAYCNALESRALSVFRQDVENLVAEACSANLDENVAVDGVRKAAKRALEATLAPYDLTASRAAANAAAVNQLICIFNYTKEDGK